MGFIRSPNFALAFSLLFFSLYTCLALASDTISANQSLSGDQTITSSGGKFVLGFHKPGKSSNYYYICLWYRSVTPITVAWVANRETPVTDKYNSTLGIVDGNLVLYNNSHNTPIWSTNQTLTRSNSVVAVLRDNGNLVLLDKLESDWPVWQSFDFPAHTWFPGSKLSYNKITKTPRWLTSWKNSEDPSPGLYSYFLDADKQFHMLRNGMEQYWTSGPWNGRTFRSVPEMNPNFIYNFCFIDNENESYFWYSLKDDSLTPYAISAVIMDVSGQQKMLAWLETTKQWNQFWSRPSQQCEVYAFCGDFSICNSAIQPFCNCLYGFNPRSDNEWKQGDYSGGCVRRTQLQCENSSLVDHGKDRFMEYLSLKFPVNAQLVSVDSISGCESVCSNNCSCTAYAYENGQCSIWIGELVNIERVSGDDSSGKKLYLKLAGSELSGSKNNEGMIIGLVVGLIVLVLVLCLLFIFVWKGRGSIWKIETTEGFLVAFAYKDLQNATKNFSEKLGGGGFGSVFKGTLPNSTVVAVKKLESINQGEKEFRAEVSTMGTIQHVNLVRLCGFCSDRKKRLLVYEYMQNGSLNSHLFGKMGAKVLDWNTRYQIALGTARGLAYLHEKCRNCIIHCDIKPENILLDGEFCPKVADFGLAKLLGRDFSRVLTTMRGTIGYLAPEWLSGVAITTKADVYSYGMMLFEFVSGRRNRDTSEDRKEKFLPTLAARMVVGGDDILGLLDQRLERHADPDEVTRICRIACWCIQDEENHRPSMGQVVQILERVSEVNPAPIPQSLQVFGDNESSSSQSSHSHAMPIPDH